MSRKSSCNQRFFKVILLSTIAEKRLSLPSDFAKKFGSELSNVVQLRIPSSDSNHDMWTVKLTRSEWNDEIWFEGANWNRLMHHYPISAGSFLVFKYKGKSNFKVHIFNTGAMEIKYPKRQLGMKIKNEEESDDDLSNFAFGSSNAASSKHCRTGEPVNGDEDNNVAIKKRRISLHPDIIKSYKFSSTVETISDETRNALEKLAKYKPKNPCFLVVLVANIIRDQNVYVPAAFANRYLEDEKELKVVGFDRSKEAKCLRVRVHKVPGGGMRFRKASCDYFKVFGLEEGDICIFERINRTKGFVLKLTVFRASN